MRKTFGSALLLALLAVACGDDDTGAPDAAAMTADAPQAVDASPPIDAVPAPPDAPPPMPDAAPSGVYEGRVSMSEAMVGASGAQSNAEALFVSGSIWGPELGVDGDCTMYGQGPTEGWSAGAITMTGGTTPLTLLPSGTAPTVTYALVADPLLDAFTPGATVTMTAAGSADIPAFTGDVVAPEKVMGWTPPTSISRAAGWSTTWTVGTGDAIWTYVIGFDPGGNQRLVLCRTTDDGAYTVTPSALALIPAGYTQAVAAVLRVNETVVTAGLSTIYLYIVDVAGSEPITLGP